MNKANFAAQIAELSSSVTIPFTGDVTVAGALTTADLSVTDDQVVTDDTTIDGSLTVTENVTITGPGIDTQSVPSADHASTVDLLEIAATSPVNTTGTNTLNFLTIDAAIGNASGGTNAVRGIQIDAITADAQVTETAINVDSGWDVCAALNGALSFTGATAVNEIRLVTNLADALSIEDTAGDLIVFDTTTGTQVITITPSLVVTGSITANGGITLNAGDNIALATSTGTKIGTATSQLLGFYNATPVDQPAALTAQLTSITHTAPGTPDYALQDLVQNTGFGFATADEGNTALSVILNLQVRLAEVEARLEELGLVATN